MSEITNRINDVLKDLGIQKTKFYKDCKVTSSAFAQWNVGNTNPRPVNLRRIADYLGVEYKWLATGEGQKEKAPTPQGERSDSLGLVPTKAGGAVRIPVLGSVPAGTPIEAIEDIVDWEEIPGSMTRGGKEFFALKVKGDSMFPEYLDGDTVIVQLQPECESGDDCVVYVNGYNATLKTVHLNVDGGLTLQPINPQYPPRTFTRDEVRDCPVQILGVVVEIRRKKRNK